MGPLSLYLSLVYWVYPMKSILGESGCYILLFLRTMGTFAIQLQSFFMATFRYICLLHEDLLFRFSLSPEVSVYIFSCIFHSTQFNQNFWNQQSFHKRSSHKINTIAALDWEFWLEKQKSELKFGFTQISFSKIEDNFILSAFQLYWFYKTADVSINHEYNHFWIFRFWQGQWQCWIFSCQHFHFLLSLLTILLPETSA